MEEEFYTIEEVAQRFKVTTKTVYDWMKRGDLAYVELGGGARRRITSSAINHFVRQPRKGSGGTSQDQDQSINHKGGQLEYTPA